MNQKELSYYFSISDDMENTLYKTPQTIEECKNFLCTLDVVATSLVSFLDGFSSPYITKRHPLHNTEVKRKLAVDIEDLIRIHSDVVDKFVSNGFERKATFGEVSVYGDLMKVISTRLSTILGRLTRKKPHLYLVK